jgi:hypothetical protein
MKKTNYLLLILKKLWRTKNINFTVFGSFNSIDLLNQLLSQINILIKKMINKI